MNAIILTKQLGEDNETCRDANLSLLASLLLCGTDEHLAYM